MPTESSTVYSEPITLQRDEALYIRAVAMHPLYQSSAVLTIVVHGKPLLPPPTLLPLDVGPHSLGVLLQVESDASVMHSIDGGPAMPWPGDWLLAYSATLRVWSEQENADRSPTVTRSYEVDGPSRAETRLLFNGQDPRAGSAGNAAVLREDVEVVEFRFEVAGVESAADVRWQVVTADAEAVLPDTDPAAWIAWLGDDAVQIHVISFLRTRAASDGEVEYLSTRIGICFQAKEENRVWSSAACETSPRRAGARVDVAFKIYF